VVGISSGASAPENLVAQLIEFFKQRGVEDISEFDVVKEDVRFMLPKQIRPVAAAVAPAAEAAL
jgi:4-hydroxy-3-methylbut-2-enyl diphosphate reductase